MDDLFLKLWRTVAPLGQPDDALERIRKLLRLETAEFVSEDSKPKRSKDRRVLSIAGRTFVAKPGPDSIDREELWNEVRIVLEVVLNRDKELKELDHLREAAEAEKIAALTRLGRKEIGNEVVGRDRGLKHVFLRVEQVAASDLPVLIVGETGTGKEVVARAIHQRSIRHRNPFHRVNCGAIPPELIDSQLFGHERGAFTGATDLRKGWFERADGGTLFLDEIGELPLAAQVRLLRILQDGHFERVGGQKSLTCDVRIVAATNRDLSQMVAEERFRADLWYRIAVFPIRIPPLRERKEDISSLAEHFASRAATRFGLSPVHPSAGDLERLAAYSWPGNVREFGSVIDRAAILGNGKRLDIAAALGVPDTHPVSPSNGEDSKTFSSFPETSSPPFDDVVRSHIESALKSTQGRVSGPFGAARLLGLNSNTLRSKMRKLGIDAKRFKDS